ncbi:polyamine-modulated factor 1 [Denticeps clupeoides]|uniref:polyamine-modulated factor 1 n=1 Tax=Denticeps clupeoides TaxID=299321 RepID=UPI0010A50B11|nr:polyamine-modulated factor 1-like [Denticeps clupeoides]XP_028824109.1 polyamine-modulated factor 1-like [Denticeps clupeoides]
MDEESRSGKAEPRINRLVFLNKVLEKSLKRLVADASFYRFAQTFGPLYKQNPQVTKVIHEQFVSGLQKAVEDDINKVIEEGELEGKLKELDRLEDLAKDSTAPAWRPSGVPEQDVCSFLVPYYRGQEEFLRRELRKVQKENAVLVQRVQEGRAAISRAEDNIAKTAQEWQASIGGLEALVSSLCPAENLDAS